MRSLASESSRELVRRMNAHDADWDVWIDWNAVDFESQPSAFEPRIMAEQAKFTAACLRHLWETQGAAAGRIVVIGYSMGGLVAERALDLLASSPDPPFDLHTQLVLLLTLGTPQHHLPSFLPPAPFDSTTFIQNLLPKEGPLEEGPPRLRVLAGPGDLMIPALSSWTPRKHPCSNGNTNINFNNTTNATTTNATTSTTNSNDNSNVDTYSNVNTNTIVNTNTRSRGSSICRATSPPHSSPDLLTIQVDMDDIPGVWCTATHKSIVSCNQLVRRMVPLLTDAVHASLSGVSARHIAEMVRWRMTTHVSSAILESVSEAEVALEKVNFSKVKDWSVMRHSDNNVIERGEEQVQCHYSSTETFIAHSIALHSEKKCTVFDTKQLNGVDGALSLVFVGLQPGRQFEVVGVTQDDKKIDLTSLAAALPGSGRAYNSSSPLIKRKWNEVLAGIDWISSAAWILHIPLGSASEQFYTVEVHYRGPSKGQPSILAQIVPAAAATAAATSPDLVLNQVHVPCLPGAPTALLKAEHAMIVELQGLDAWKQLLTLDKYKMISRAAAAFIFGAAPPWRVSLTTEQCSPLDNPSSDAPYLSPTIIALGRSSESGRRIMPAADSVFSNSAASLGVSLWHPAVVGRTLLLVSDQSRSYSLRVDWDVARWAAYTLRYHMTALAPVTLALAILRLSGSKSTFIVLLMPALLIPAASIYPASLDGSSSSTLATSGSLLGSLQAHLSPYLSFYPWLPMSFIDICIVISVAFALLQTLSMLLDVLIAIEQRGARVFIHIAPGTGALSRAFYRTRGIVAMVAVVAVVGSTFLHPAAPPLCGTVLLFIALGIPHQSKERPHVDVSKNTVISSDAPKWTLVHLIGSVPAVVWLVGALSSDGIPFLYPLICWERALMAVNGAHASYIAWQCILDRRQRVTQRPGAAVCGIAAGAAALLGIVGELHLVVYVWTGLSAWSIVIEGFRWAHITEKKSV